MRRQGTIFKRCGCRDTHGRKLDGRCPRLRRRDGAWNPKHGTWQYILELPSASDGTRRRLRRGGFATQAEIDDEIDTVNQLLAIPDPDDPDTLNQVVELILHTSRTTGTLPPVEEVRRRVRAGQPLGELPTVAQWLEQWLRGKKRIRKTTRVSYASHIRLYLTPHLGCLRLDRLRVSHVADMFDAIDERNQLIQHARRPVEIPTGTDQDTARLLRRNHTDLRKKLRYQRVVEAASKQRIRATLRAALNAAISQQLITFNPAAHVELASGKSPKALVWTPERVTRWQHTGQRPSPVMVWTPAQTGTFLDHTTGSRLYALYHLIAYRGLRRGEACGLRWEDVDLDAKTLTVRWQILVIEWHTEHAEPKSEAGDRVIALDDTTIAVLRAHRARQAQERLATGTTWTDTGLVFTTELGTSLHPAIVSGHFTDLVTGAGLPPVRLHDLRHGAATYMLAAGADTKVVQETLGHAQYATTANIYTSVLPELAHAAAENIARYIPRSTVNGTDGHPSDTHPHSGQTYRHQPNRKRQ